MPRPNSARGQMKRIMAPFTLMMPAPPSPCSTRATISVDSDGATEFARGLTNYDATAVRAIAGQRKEEIIRTLGVVPYDEVIRLALDAYEKSLKEARR